MATHRGRSPIPQPASSTERSSSSHSIRCPVATHVAILLPVLSHASAVRWLLHPGNDSTAAVLPSPVSIRTDPSASAAASNPDATQMDASKT